MSARKLLRYGAGGFDWAALPYGTFIQGGYYAGRMNIDGQKYAILVSPKSAQATGIQFRTIGEVNDPTNKYDGWTNTNAMNNSEHPVAQYCRSLTTNGFNDWYLPALDELELLYRNLKPTSSANSVGTRIYDGYPYGYNGYSDPGGSAYTTSSPAQTPSAIFQPYNAEYMTPEYHWSSTQPSDVSYHNQAMVQHFEYGTQTVGGKTNTGYYVRPIRRVLT